MIDKSKNRIFLAKTFSKKKEKIGKRNNGYPGGKMLQRSFLSNLYFSVIISLFVFIFTTHIAVNIAINIAISLTVNVTMSITLYILMHNIFCKVAKPYSIHIRIISTNKKWGMNMLVLRVVDCVTDMLERIAVRVYVWIT